MDRQGNIKDFQGNKIIPNTSSVAVLDVARQQALSASLLALVEKNALGFPDFTTAEAHPVGQEVYYDRKLWEFTDELAQGAAWDATKVREFSVKEYADVVGAALTANIEAGLIVPALAKNIDSWMHTDAVVEDRFADLVRTTAGDVSILSDRGGQMKSIVALSDFKATEFRATGFNLLRDAVAVADGYFFLVPPMRFGEFGTAAEANGVLFTNAQGVNLKPTVYFKPLSEGEPQTTTDGTPCAFTDSHGYRFFTTSEVGFLVVSGITLNQTCAHVGWSRRYDEYVAVDAATDAGGSVPLTAILSALHASGTYAGWMLTVGNVADRIDWLRDGVATWTRNVDFVAPEWTTEADPETEGVYIHSATIATMKEGGAAKFMTEDIELNVNGTTISYSDDSATAVSDTVKFELADAVTGTVNVSNLYALNDWGLEKYRNVLGTAATQSNYKQDVKDTVRSLATVQFDNTVRVLTEALVQCREDINRLKGEVDALKEQINS